MTETSWFADESFWEVTYPFMFGETRVTSAPREVDAIIALTRAAPGPLLDLACGPGRHAAAFAKAGFRVTGVDRSPFLLAKARAAALSPEIEWVESDMRTFSRPGTFDIAICLYTSFGFFDDDDDNRLVLQRVHENLRPGGRFVLDVMGKETLAKIYQPTGSTKLPGVGTAFTRRVPGVTNQWTLPTSPPATTTGP